MAWRPTFSVLTLHSFLTNNYYYLIINCLGESFKELPSS